MSLSPRAQQLAAVLDARSYDLHRHVTATLARAYLVDASPAEVELVAQRSWVREFGRLPNGITPIAPTTAADSPVGPTEATSTGGPA